MRAYPTFLGCSTFVIAVLTISSACSRPEQMGSKDTSGESEVPIPQQNPPETRVLVTPQDTTPCIRPEPDSATAVAAAISLMSEPEVPLRLSSLLRHHDGMLISMVPVETYMAGGGGLVWVDRDGCLLVIKRNE
jgi:hypothetical protein